MRNSELLYKTPQNTLYTHTHTHTRYLQNMNEYISRPKDSVTKSKEYICKLFSEHRFCINLLDNTLAPHTHTHQHSYTHLPTLFPSHTLCTVSA